MKIDEEKLKEYGIANNGKIKQFCPACHASRSNKRDKSLFVKWNKCFARCYHCDAYYFFGKSEEKDYAPKTSQQNTMKTESKEYKKPGRLTTAEPLDENMQKWFESRSIPVEIAETEGIFKASRKMSQTEKIEKCIVFPYTVEGELVNRKYRDGAKHFMLESGAKLVPWRIDHILESPSR